MYSSEDYAGIRMPEFKRALAATLERNTKPKSVVAAMCGVAPQTLAQWESLQYDAYPSGFRFMQLLGACDDPTLLRFACSFHNAVPVNLPKCAGKRSDVSHLAAIASTFARLLLQHAEASSDGKWTVQEVDALRPIVDELVSLALGQIAYAEREAALAGVYDMARRGA